jgi:predicted phage terminase large subunit-like protein
LARGDFLEFVKMMWPGFIYGRHHKILADVFNRVASGELKRVTISIPPRHTKSEFASYLFPAWFLGRFPEKKIMQASNTAELAVGFGRKVRNLLDSEQYGEVFPDVGLRKDSKAAGRWSTNKDGEYFAVGVGGTMTGKGADIMIIDDPHTEQEAKQAEHNPAVFDSVYEWYTSGPRQRLQPGGAIVIIQTRWSKRDLIGRVLKDSVQRDGEEWEVVQLPAIMPSGKPLWPEFWSLEELTALRNELPNAKWQAQYQQEPTSDSAALIKRESWRIWDSEHPPHCEFTLMAWDTAFEKNNRADYSACTIWGVFYKEDDNGVMQPNIILLNAVRDRVEFPELKKLVLKLHKEWEPDATIIEKKASGAPLIYELRSMGVPVSEFTPVRGNDKISRLNAVSDIFASGRVWAPNKHWAEEVIEEVASFPSGDHDDYCFIAGTMITMADMTEKPIEQIQIGDIVHTPDGACKVTAAGLTGYKTVIELTTESTQLVGTANHPIFTHDGWKNIDSISMADTIEVLSINVRSSCHLKAKEMLLLKRLCLTAKNTIGIQIAKIQRTVNILQGRAHGCIGMCGSFITGQYQRVATYITSMATQQTITFKTLRAYRQKNIIRRTWKKNPLPTNLKNKLNISLKFVIKRRIGINLKRVLRGIGNTLKLLCAKQLPLAKPKKLAWYVCNAVQITKPKIQKEASFALTNALAHQVEITQSKQTKFDRVIGAKEVGQKYVYNLTVDKSHTYYANKVLVHNCDTVSMALARFRKGGYITTNLDEEESNSWVQAHRKPYY